MLRLESLAMPAQDDINEVREFVDHTIATYHLVTRTAQMAPNEREALQLALGEFVQRAHRDRIVDQYRELIDDPLIIDSGLYGQQLRQKRELARIAAEAFEPEDAERAGSQPRGYVGRVRRWIKRAKVLAGSLKRLVSGAEALDQLLDLLDGALDRR